MFTPSSSPNISSVFPGSTAVWVCFMTLFLCVSDSVPAGVRCSGGRCFGGPWLLPGNPVRLEVTRPGPLVPLGRVPPPPTVGEASAVPICGWRVGASRLPLVLGSGLLTVSCASVMPVDHTTRWASWGFPALPPQACGPRRSPGASGLRFLPRTSLLGSPVLALGLERGGCLLLLETPAGLFDPPFSACER